MKKAFPGAQLKLPGKRLFGNFEPLFIRHRRDGLAGFVQHIMDSPDMFCQLVIYVITISYINKIYFLK